MALAYFHAEIGTLPDKNNAAIDRGNGFTNNIEIRGERERREETRGEKEKREM